jgi:hypothetical protein
VQRLLWAIVLVTILAGTAAAEPGLWPKRLRALYLGGGVSYLGSESIGGPALTGEQAWGYGTWQLAGEASVRWLPMSGVAVRSAVDARWLARSFSPDGSAALELYLDGSLGAELIAQHGVLAARPDLRLGWGLQVRDVGNYRIRFAMRITLAPSFERDAAEMIACRGTCKPTASTSSPPFDEGFEVLVGVAW